ncbi:metallophosphoesterase [Pseudovibrio exalbescens]|uniref:metallophosphoesterase n=1 Tax=Pseudovibrio exalbescens TaxID=197461 RepID=UPI0023655E47|nr:metallophosphoesterase [Pseudovibrio exalbescens]MDD7909505.1 metallophosphoesterase [Pseudovibrio exalbescens]
MLIAFLALSLLGLFLLTYAVLVEPMRVPVVRRYTMPMRGLAHPLRVAALGDFHACVPWMNEQRILGIVRQVNGLKPDLAMLLGDFETGIHAPFLLRKLKPDEWARPLAELEAPLGRFAVLGNHDWLEDLQGARQALAEAKIPVLENEARLIPVGGNEAIWVAGLADQYTNGKLWQGREGADDLDGTLAQIFEDQHPVLLLAHEPDIFEEPMDRVGLVLSGHTHGGQVRLPFLGALTVPSRFGTKYAQGLFRRGGTRLLVTAGLGCSRLPLRFNCPPEIMLVDLIPENTEEFPK